MSQNKKQGVLQKFLNNKRSFPVLAGILAGLYPMLFYASNNYTLINTLGHLGYFLMMYITIPVVVIWLLYTFSKKVVNGKYTKYVIPFLGSFIFLFLMHISYFGFLKKKISVGLLLIAVLIAFFLWRQFKKLIVIQGLLAIIGLITLVPRLIEAITYDDSWGEVSSEIREATFVKKPNIYYIQPDGYVNFSELYKGHYKSKDSTFQKYLTKNSFTFYPDFRSNYASTLTSNSATFMMKHHYYNGNLTLENYNARDVIVSKNTVLDILKSNNYKTHLLTELPYLLLNRPKMGYDFCNIDYNDVNYIGTGLGKPVSTYDVLMEHLSLPTEQPNFFFIEIFNPGHIHGNANKSQGVQGERALWFESLEMAHMKVKKHVDLIKQNDPNALIILMADHGGFVGLDYTQQALSKIEDRDLLYSIYSANLAIHWPNKTDLEKELPFKSGVNFFRVLISYLSNNQKLLEEQENNGSYAVIKEGASPAIYQVIDDNGNVTFKKQ